jgi:hypothetical protein
MKLHNGIGKELLRVCARRNSDVTVKVHKWNINTVRKERRKEERDRAKENK